jgi:anti-sigma B factor antagonist
VSTSAEVAVERHGDLVVAHVSGEVDMANAAYVHDELIRSVPNDAAGLAIDLTETRYLDSAGIALLFDLAKRLGRRRQGLRLVLPPTSPLQRVLALTEVDSVAPIHQSLDSALAE